MLPCWRRHPCSKRGGCRATCRDWAGRKRPLDCATRARVVAKTQERPTTQPLLFSVPVSPRKASIAFEETSSKQTSEECVGGAWQGRGGDAEAALSKRRYVSTYLSDSATNHCAIEPHAASVAWTGVRLAVHDSRNVHLTRSEPRACVWFAGVKVVSSPFVGRIRQQGFVESLTFSRPPRRGTRQARRVLRSPSSVYSGSRWSHDTEQRWTWVRARMQAHVADSITHCRVTTHTTARAVHFSPRGTILAESYLNLPGHHRIDLVATRSCLSGRVDRYFVSGECAR